MYVLVLPTVKITQTKIKFVYIIQVQLFMSKDLTTVELLNRRNRKFLLADFTIDFYFNSPVNFSPRQNARQVTDQHFFCQRSFEDCQSRNPPKLRFAQRRPLRSFEPVELSTSPTNEESSPSNHRIPDKRALPPFEMTPVVNTIPYFLWLIPKYTCGSLSSERRNAHRGRPLIIQIALRLGGKLRHSLAMICKQRRQKPRMSNLNDVEICGFGAARSVSLSPVAGRSLEMSLNNPRSVWTLKMTYLERRASHSPISIFRGIGSGAFQCPRLAAGQMPDVSPSAVPKSHRIFALPRPENAKVRRNPRWTEINAHLDFRY